MSNWLEVILQDYHIEMKNIPNKTPNIQVITKEVALKHLKDTTRKYARQINKSYREHDKSRLHNLINEIK